MTFRAIDTTNRVLHQSAQVIYLSIAINIFTSENKFDGLIYLVILFLFIGWLISIIFTIFWENEKRFANLAKPEKRLEVQEKTIAQHKGKIIIANICVASIALVAIPSYVLITKKIHDNNQIITTNRYQELTEAMSSIHKDLDMLKEDIADLRTLQEEIRKSIGGKTKRDGSR